MALGPKPRKYKQRTPKKMIRLALALGAVRPGQRGQGRRRRRGASTRRPPRRPQPPRLPRRHRPGARRAQRPTRSAARASATSRRAASSSRRAQHLRRPRQRLRRLHADTLPRRPSAPRAPREERLKDPRDVILRPVVSEKSYGLLEQRLHVHRPPRAPPRSRSAKRSRRSSTCRSPR